MQSAPPFRNPAVRVAVNELGTITGVAVAGRPRPHPFGNAEGSHVTAWSVFADSVRRLVVGTDVRTAGLIVLDLVDELDDPNGTEAAKLLSDRRTLFNGVADLAWAAAKQAFNSGSVKDLEGSIACYLTARNLAPLAAVYLGPAAAKGRGEGGPLRKLRRFEESGQGYAPGTLVAALVGLLDIDAVQYIGAAGDPAKSPGISGNGAASAFDAVLRHLTEVSRAYPLAYAASGLGTATVFNRHFPSVPVASDDDLPILLRDWDFAPVGWSAAGGKLCLVTATVENGVVTWVEFDGRGNTLLDGQGHHVTAHVAIEQVVRRQMVGKPVGDALQALLALAERITGLATWPATPDIPLEVDPKGIFAAALATFLAAFDSARAITTDQAATVDDVVVELESLAGAYVMMRNAMPMASVLLGSTADGNSEGRIMTMSGDWDAQRKPLDRGKACWALWQLLDFGTVNALGTDKQLGINEWAPGAPLNRGERVARVLATHLQTIEEAFPYLAGACSFRSNASVNWALKTIDVTLSAEFRNGLGLSDEIVSPTIAFKTVSTKRWDAMDYDPNVSERKQRGKPKRKRRKL